MSNPPYKSGQDKLRVLAAALPQGQFGIAWRTGLDPGTVSKLINRPIRNMTLRVFFILQKLGKQHGVDFQVEDFIGPQGKETEK